jgi:hypothetical protein
MWESRDLALVIILSVAGFVYSLIIGQVGLMLTGIAGVNYLFTIGHAIFVSLGLLLFEGRRWRFSIQVTLFSFLTLPTYLMGTPYNVLPRIPLILAGIQADMLFNTVYEIFKKRNKQVVWAVLVSVEFFLIDPLLRILTYPFYLPSQYTLTFFNVTLLLLPVIIIEASMGGYLGYKIYNRIEKP